MDNQHKQLKVCVWSFLASLMICTPAWAEDTEIYFGGTSTNISVKPNVLFVLDTSGSMTSTDGTGQTRLARMKEALTNILNNAQDVNVGLMRFTNPGGPILYPVTDIDQEIVSESQQTVLTGNLSSSISTGAGDAEESADGTVTLGESSLNMVTVTTSAVSGSVSSRVSSGNDDAEEFSDGEMYRSSTDLELMRDGGVQTVGLRFSSVNIPTGATITDARITFEIDEERSASSNPVGIRISAEDADDPSSFSSSDNNISNRTKTSASSTWNITSNPAVNNDLTTPNLASVVQEVVNRGGWSANNAMVFILEEVSGSGVRWVESYNGESSNAPLLEVSYSSGSSSSGNHTVGLRFESLFIPQGATISAATINFTADNSDSGSTSLVFHGEDADQASAFTAAANDISGRTTTTASTGWNAMPAWSDGTQYTSPDLTSIVQEIVNRSGWCGGNAMNIIVSGSGLRIAKSYENAPSQAATLNISFDPDSNPNGCVNQEYSVRVNQSSDDAEEKSDSSMYLDSSDLELINDGGDQTIGIRFNNVQLNKNTTLATAYLELAVDETDPTESTTLTIKAEAADNSGTFTTTSGNISGRTTGSASVSWAITEQWSTEHELKRSPNIASLINEVVARSGWQPGNSLSLVITGSGKRTVESYDGSSLAPRLVYYASPATVPETTNTVRNEMITIVNELDHKSGTPIVDSLYEAALYYRGAAVDYGKTRGSGDDSSQAKTRVSHPDSYTGGSLSQPTGCSSDNLSSINCANEAITGSAMYKSPIKESCQTNHIVLLTDGYASVNTSASKVKALTGDTSCINSGSSACGPEIVSFLKNVDQKGTQTSSNRVKTHTIGFNFSDQWLRDLASVHGGGGFYEANSAVELTSAFNTIIKSIRKENSSFAKAAVTASHFSRFAHRDDVYFTVFKPGETVQWAGNLKRYKLNSYGRIYDNSSNPILAVDPSSGYFASNTQSFWTDTDSADGDSGVDEGDQQPDGSEVSYGGAAHRLPTVRKLFTDVSGTLPNISLNVDDNKLHEDNTLITKELLGTEAQSDAYREDVIQWARGLTSTGAKRNQMGDVLHSQPKIITYNKNTGSEDSSIFVGTNEGFIHAIDTSTGIEQFAYVPKELLPSFDSLFSNKSTEEVAHPYGIDGSIITWTKDHDKDGVISPTTSGDFAYIYAGMRRGGRNYYALDVTDRANPKLKWKITGGSGDFAELGQTWSTPIKTRVKINDVAKEVLIFGGGYDPAQDDVSVRTVDSMGNAIFMVDAGTGALIWSAGDNNNHDLVLSDMKYSIPSDMRMVDMNLNGYVDQLYVGDMGGQIWRFDIDNDATSVAGLVSGAAIANLAGTAAADNRRFYYPPSLSIAQDDGTSSGNDSRYLALAIGSGYRAHPLNTVIQDRQYLIKMPDLNKPSSYPSYTESDLYDATDNLYSEGTVVDGINLMEVAKNALDYSSTIKKDGWYIRLEGSGEKVLSKNLIINGQVIFATYEPTPAQSGSCVATQGTNRVYDVKLPTAVPMLELSGDGQKTKVDRAQLIITPGIAGGLTVLSGENGSQLHIGQTTPPEDIDLGELSVRTYWIEENK